MINGSYNGPWGDYQWFPTVAYNGSTYLVVWGDSRFSQNGFGADLFGVRVNSAGTPTDTLGFRITPASTAYPGLAYPVVAACNGSDFLVAWGQNGNNATQLWDFYGARVNTAGTVLDTTPFPIVAQRYQWAADAAFSSKSMMLVTWGPEAASQTRLVADVLALDIPPVVVTLPASDITENGGTLNGTVTPVDAATYAWFEWGTTVAYGNTSVTFGLVPGSTPVSLSDQLTGLTSGTTYRFRLVAMNSFGTDYGIDQTFTTTTPVVTNPNDSGAGALRAVIAGALPGDTITFAPGVGGMITLTSGELAINGNLTITGPGAKMLTISGNNSSGVFHIHGGTVTISGLTVANTDYPNSGVRIEPGANLTLGDCTIRDNTALYGGGIYNAGNLTMKGCTLVNNTSTDGGAIFTDGTASL